MPRNLKYIIIEFRNSMKRWNRRLDMNKGRITIGDSSEKIIQNGRKNNKEIKNLKGNLIDIENRGMFNIALIRLSEGANR